VKILAIALNTFRESIRDKVLYNLLFFALLLIVVSILFATLTIGEQSKIIMDIGLASINIFGVLIAVFLGIGLISKEIEKRTIYTIISKPIARYQFLIGKYLGLILTLSINTLIMGVGLYLVLMLNQWRWDLNVVDINLSLWKAIFLMFFEFMVMTAVAMLFSSFTSSSTLSAIFSLAVYCIGHFTEDLRSLGERSQDQFLQGTTTLFYYLLPNLDNFNVKELVGHNLQVPYDFMGWVLLYGLLYCSMLILLAVFLFRGRDFQ
jgi:ABC-type transport system involved in multi-copper enzyme maturation permease subunit